MAIEMFIYIAVMIISMILQVFLTPKPMVPKLLPGDITNVPVAEFGNPIPVVFGRRFLRQPNVVWWGRPRVKAIRKKASSKS